MNKEVEVMTHEELVDFFLKQGYLPMQLLGKSTKQLQALYDFEWTTETNGVEINE